MSNSLQNSSGNSLQNGSSDFQFIPNYSGDENSVDNGLNPEKIIGILFSYKWLILSVLIVCATGAWFAADLITPTYASKGTLLISPMDATQNDELSNIIAQTTGYGRSSTLENELQVLQSRKFSRQVAQKLMSEEKSAGPLDFPLMWSQEEDGTLIKASEDAVAARIGSNLEFDQPEEQSDVVEITFKSPSPEEAAKVVNLVLEIYVENSTQQNRQAAASTSEYLEKEMKEIKQKLDESEQKLRRYMDKSGIVQVDEQATAMANRRATIEVDLQRVNVELQTIEETIANYENRLEKIKPGLSEQFSEAIGPRIQSLQEELARFENERMQIVAKNPTVLEQKPVPPRLKFIDDQVGRLKSEIKKLSQQLFTENDEFIGIDAQARAGMVSEIQNRLIELRIQKNQLTSRREALQKQKAGMDRDFNSLPEGMMELAKLQRDVRINEELYLNISRKHADMSIWKESQFGFGRIIDRGEKPQIPVSPNKKILVLLGLMLGGVLSVGFITIKEYRDNSVKSVNELRKHLPKLMFSAIPTLQKVSVKDRKYFTIGNGQIPDELVLLQDPSSIVSESFRRLKNNIIYQNGIAPPKTIAVTSPEKGDGKSTVVSNLGIAFAEEGYKTLLVGADFRRPKLQEYFGLTAQDGLYDYLKGDLTFQESLMLIQNSELQDLKVITAGRETQNPEIIGKSKMFKQFLKKMEEVFDVILIDTPPFGIISDSTALLKDAEATLVVVRHRKTNSGLLIRTIEELGRIQSNVSGIVLNDFDHEKELSGGDYYQTMYGSYEAYVE